MNISKNEWQNGGIMLGGFILYFLVMKWAGLYQNVNFRVLNVLIHGFFIFQAVKYYKNTRQGELDYAHGAAFLSGLRTSIVGVAGFVFFQFIFLSFVEPGFLDSIRTTALMGHMLTPVTTSVFLIFEGLGVTFMFSYLAMRFFEPKNPPVTLPKE